MNQSRGTSPAPQRAGPSSTTTKMPTIQQTSTSRQRATTAPHHQQRGVFRKPPAKQKQRLIPEKADPRVSQITPDIRFQDETQRQLYDTAVVTGGRIGGVNKVGIDSETTIAMAQQRVKTLQSVAYGLANVVDYDHTKVDSNVAASTAQLDIGLEEETLGTTSSVMKQKATREIQDERHYSALRDIREVLTHDDPDDGVGGEDDEAYNQMLLQHQIARIRSAVGATMIKPRTVNVLESTQGGNSAQNTTMGSRRGPILEAYRRAMKGEVKKKEETKQEAQKMDTAISGMALQDKQRRLEIKRIVDEADHPSKLVPVLWNLCDVLQKQEARLLYAYLHMERLNLRAEVISGQLNHMNKDAAAGILGDVRKMQDDIEFFESEREWLYKKMKIFEIRCSGIDDHDGQAVYIQRLEEETNKLRSKGMAVRMQQAGLRGKLRKMENMIPKYEQQLMHMSEANIKTEALLDQTRQKYLAQLDTTANSTEDTAKQAAELERVLASRRHYLLKNSVVLRVAMERFKVEKSKFMDDVLKQSGVTKTSEATREQFVKFVSAGHDTMLTTITDLYQTLVEDIAPFVDTDLATRWTQHEDPIIILLSQRLTLPNPYALYTAAADVLRQNWAALAKVFYSNGKGMFETFAQLQREHTELLEQEAQTKQEIDTCHKRIEDLERQLSETKDSMKRMSDAGLKGEALTREINKTLAKEIEEQLNFDPPEEEAPSVDATSSEEKKWMEKYNGMVARFNNLQNREKEKTRRILELDGGSRLMATKTAELEEANKALEAEIARLKEQLQGGGVGGGTKVTLTGGASSPTRSKKGKATVNSSGLKRKNRKGSISSAVGSVSDIVAHDVRSVGGDREQAGTPASTIISVAPDGRGVPSSNSASPVARTTSPHNLLSVQDNQLSSATPAGSFVSPSPRAITGSASENPTDGLGSPVLSAASPTNDRRGSESPKLVSPILASTQSPIPHLSHSIEIPPSTVIEMVNAETQTVIMSKPTMYNKFAGTEPAPKMADVMTNTPPVPLKPIRKTASTQMEPVEPIPTSQHETQTTPLEQDLQDLSTAIAAVQADFEVVVSEVGIQAQPKTPSTSSIVALGASIDEAAAKVDLMAAERLGGSLTSLDEVSRGQTPAAASRLGSARSRHSSSAGRIRPSLQLHDRPPSGKPSRGPLTPLSDVVERVAAAVDTGSLVSFAEIGCQTMDVEYQLPSITQQQQRPASASSVVLGTPPRVSSRPPSGRVKSPIRTPLSSPTPDASSTSLPQATSFVLHNTDPAVSQLAMESPLLLKNADDMDLQVFPIASATDDQELSVADTILSNTSLHEAPSPICEVAAVSGSEGAAGLGSSSRRVSAKEIVDGKQTSTTTVTNVVVQCTTNSAAPVPSQPPRASTPPTPLRRRSSTTSTSEPHAPAPTTPPPLRAGTPTLDRRQRLQSLVNDEPPQDHSQLSVAEKEKEDAGFAPADPSLQHAAVPVTSIIDRRSEEVIILADDAPSGYRLPYSQLALSVLALHRTLTRLFELLIDFFQAPFTYEEPPMASEIYQALRLSSLSTPMAISTVGHFTARAAVLDRSLAIRVRHHIESKLHEVRDASVYPISTKEQGSQLMSTLAGGSRLIDTPDAANMLSPQLRSAGEERKQGYDSTTIFTQQSLRQLRSGGSAPVKRSSTRIASAQPLTRTTLTAEPKSNIVVDGHSSSKPQARPASSALPLRKDSPPPLPVARPMSQQGNRYAHRSIQRPPVKLQPDAASIKRPETR